MPNFKSMALVVLELIAFNGQNFKVTRDPGSTPFQKIFSEVMSGQSLGSSSSSSLTRSRQGLLCGIMCA